MPGLEPTLPHYGCGVLAATRPVRLKRRKDESRPAVFHSSFILPPSSFQSGAGGIRTPAGRGKSSLCCRYTTTPDEDVVTFVWQVVFHDVLLAQSLGTELNRRSRRISTMCFRDTTRRLS